MDNYFWNEIWNEIKASVNQAIFRRFIMGSNPIHSAFWSIRTIAWKSQKTL